MKSMKNHLKKAVEFVAIKSVKIACGTASANHFCQPKEPENIKLITNKK